ncbi:MAG: hypothetical protein KBT04_06415 [Bacteroidales bacterium]|nr:hypothetical protein [Candidatus Colimorpha onthohippi]
MSKPYLIIATCVCLAAAVSCTKDDDDFKEVTNGKIGVTGGDIAFGLPVGTSTVNAGQLLNNWQNTACVIGSDEHGTLTLNYDESYEQTIYFNSEVQSSKPAGIDYNVKASKDAFKYDTSIVMSNRMHIDLFKNFPDVNGFDIKDIQASLAVDVKANASISEPLRKYIKKIYVQDITISTISENGEIEENIYEQSVSDTIPLDELITGTTLTIYDESNIDQLVRNRPKYMSYSMKLKIELEASQVNLHEVINITKYLKEIAKIESIETNTHVSAHFPLRLKCDDLEYRDTIKFPLQDIKDVLDQSGDKLALGSSFYLAMKFTNELPIQIRMNDELVDSEGNTVLVDGDPVHIYTPDAIIKSAKTTIQEIGGLNFDFSVGAETTYMLVKLTQEQIRQINDADNLIVYFHLSTIDGKYISIRNTDCLTTQIYILVNPSEEYLKEKFGEEVAR